MPLSNSFDFEDEIAIAILNITKDAILKSNSICPFYNFYQICVVSSDPCIHHPPSTIHHQRYRHFKKNSWSWMVDGGWWMVDGGW